MSKLLKEHGFKTKSIVKGYTDRILHINLSDLSIKEKDVPPIMKEKFIGGKGYGLRLLWDATKPDTKWDDPENEIVIAPGPLCGVTQYAGAGKSLVDRARPLRSTGGRTQAHRHRQQRRRTCRPLPENMRVRCAGNPGQSGHRRSDRHRRGDRKNQF